MSGIHRTAALRGAAYLSMFLMAGAYAQQEPAQEGAAQQEAAPQEPAGNSPGESAWQAAGAAMQHGPTVIQLADQARLSLPEGYGFVPKQEAAAVMELMGNRTGEQFLGLIFPDAKANWMASVDYEPSGYIEDGDAKDWDADDMLKQLKEGTQQANERRRKQGISELEVTRWIEPPTYDSPQHRLVWSLEAREIGAQGQDPTINYNTYVLGREGYISLNLITSSAQIEKDKPKARELLAAVDFNEGKRYTDFDASSDKVAAYGLAALVGGLAAKKLGLLAAAGLLLVKFGKLILIGIAALAGITARAFSRRKAA